MTQKWLWLLGLGWSFGSLNAQDIQWERSYGGVHADYLMDALPTPDYGFILAGSSLSEKSGNKSEKNNGDLDFWVWKMKENGDLDWQKNFGGSGQDFLQSVALTKDGGFVLAGTSASFIVNPNKKPLPSADFDKKEPARGNDDFWIIKLNAAGQEEWQKTIGGTGQEKLLSIKPTPDGGYIIGGSSASEPKDDTNTLNDKTSEAFGNMDYWLVKIDRNGQLMWQKTFGGQFFDELRSLVVTADGGFLLGGYSNSPTSGNKLEDNNGIGDFWIIKTDANGNMIWQKTLGNKGDDQLYVVHQCQDGNFLAGGSTTLAENGADFWVIKLDTSGQMIWQQTYNTDTTDILTSMVENKDQSLLLGGYSPTTPVNNQKTDGGDYIMIKTNAMGEPLWQRTVGSKGDDLLKKAIETRDGGYLMAGTSNAKPSGDKSQTMGSNDFWVVKLKDNNKTQTQRNSLEAYPNPTTAFTNIIVGYPYQAGTASLYDLSGKQLQSFAITSNTIPLNLAQYPNGIYIINIDTDKQHDTVKIIKGTNLKN